MDTFEALAPRVRVYCRNFPASLHRFSIVTVLAVLPAAAPLWSAAKPMELAVDVTGFHRGVFHSREVIPVAAGPLALAYPQWVQGEHTPSGPITQVAGLTVTAGGRALAWQRDPIQLFVVRVEVPAGVDKVEVNLDYLSPPAAFGNGLGQKPNVTPHLAIVDWHDLLLYPMGGAIDQIPVHASVRLPAAWKFDTALHVEAAAGNPAGVVAFAVTSLYTLLDSPVLAGENFRTLEIVEAGAGRAPVRLSLAADRRTALEVPAARLAAYRRLPAEAEALFRARHYQEYHWLMALGEPFNNDGIEHHESSDDRGQLGIFSEPSLLLLFGPLLPHEYVHSWNGKYRRPAGLAVRDAQEPLRPGLLWVYEGLTRYLGDVVLTTRIGIRTPEQSREYLAYVAGTQERARPGRQWRPLADTAVGLPAFDGAPTAWTSYRRSRDFYDEATLIWLEADTILRQRSGGMRSLDDFCRAFFGGATTPPEVNPYTVEDVFAALGRIEPFDWRDFFTRRIDQINPHPPFGGLVAAGWRLAYDDRPNVFEAARARLLGQVDAVFSLGLSLRHDGTASDVVVGSPAWDAGLGPGMKVVAVNHATWSPESLAEALAAATHTTAPIELTVEEGDEIRLLEVDYHGGERYPHLQRDSSHPDLLAAILAPLVK